jgi:outer membrane protein TolC
VGDKFFRILPDLFESNNIPFICPALACEQNPQFRKAVIKHLSRLKKKIKLVSVTPDNFSEKISALEQTFVVVSKLHGFKEKQMEALYQSLAEKKIRSYTADGSYGIQRGALVTLHELNFVKEGRNFALKIFDILKGHTPGNLMVQDIQGTKLRLNTKTAEKIGYNIPITYIDRADLYGPRKKNSSLLFRGAIEVALKQNYDIKIQALIENQSLIQAEEIERRYYPQLSSRLDYARKDDTRADIFPEPRGESKFGINLSQKIYDRELIKTIKSAEYANEIDKRNLEVINQNIIEQVASTYMDNLFATEVVQIQKDFLEIIRVNRKIAQLKFELRETGKGDVLRLDIDLENARSDLVDAQEALFRSRVRLNVLLNIPREKEHQLELDPFSEASYKRKGTPFNKFFHTQKSFKLTRDFFTQQALSKSPDLKSIDSSIRKAESDKEIVKSRFFPTAEFNVNWFTQLHDEKRALNPIEDDNYNDRFRDGWAAQFKLDIPLFEGGTRFKQLSQANLRINEFMTRKRNLENDLSEQARTDFFNLQRRRRNADFSMRNIQSSRENLKLVELAYREGDLPIIDLLDSQRQLIFSQRDAVQARFEFYKTLFSLLRTIGKSDLILDILDDKKMENFRMEMNQFLNQKIREERLSGPPALE